jgi:hypothetical protein
MHCSCLVSKKHKRLNNLKHLFIMKKKVKLSMASMNVPELLTYATHVVTKMTGNLFFPSPTPTLAKVSTATNNLSIAYNAALGAGPTQTAVVNQNRELLELLMTSLGYYVESIANDPANATTGPEAIILSAGFEIKQTTPRQKQVFSIEHGELSGSIVLLATGLDFGSHDWQYSLQDTQPVVWISVASTTKATTTISNLEVGKRYYVRHRAILKDGPTDWEDALNIVVI